jgi:hypothetical protein
MPSILDPNISGGFSGTLPAGTYKYPAGLDLTPGSATHTDLLTKIMQRVQESSAEISKRHKSWKAIDQTLTTYMPTDEAEDLVKENDSRKPISMVIPYSFATLETLLTYFVAAFLDDPIFKYTGTSPEDRIGTILLEKVISVQAHRSKMALALHTTFRDCWGYGLGASAPIWEKRYGKKTVLQDTGFMSAIFGKFIGTGGQKKGSQDTVLYEGNSLRNIDPYLYLPDPNVPLQDMQKGEFVGWIEPTNYMKLLEREQYDKSYFNGKYMAGMKGAAGRSQYNKQNNSGRGDKTGMGSSTYSVTGTPTTTSPIDQIFLYVNLIPKEWKLGQETYPEKWLFGVGADKYIIAAKPLGLNHNMFPVSICSPDFDGYSAVPFSRLEMIGGLQTTLDWLISSHVANVRKSINDMLIVDPSLVNINDLMDPAPGKLIRMRRAAWGRGVDNAVKQLSVNDITQNHIKDSLYITELIKTCSGSVDSVMGLARQGSERVSADESRGTRMAALSRLAKAAKVVSMQMMQDLGYMLASHTQQLMSQELYVAVSGRWEEDLKAQYGDVSRVKADPFSLVVDYDVTGGDGSIPGGEDTASMVQMFTSIASQPLLAQSFDLVKIFQRIAQSSGWKDVNEFKVKQLPRVQPTVMSDQTVQSEVQKGNMVPMGGEGGMFS